MDARSFSPLLAPLFAVVTFAVVTTASAYADDLLDIVTSQPCSSIANDRVGASGRCALTDAPKGLSVDLFAAPGSVEFSLPSGIARPDGPTRQPATLRVGGLMLYNDKFAPEVWRLNAGDLLSVKLTNKLHSADDAATNLHTHGLLVSPRLLIEADDHAVEPVGDTVYVCTVPEGDAADSPSARRCKLHGSYFGTTPSEMNYSLPLPKDHPEGLYWYHPHVHMSARAQVAAGLSGLLYVKGQDINLSGGARSATGGVEPPERFLMLKDIQFGAIDATDPSHLTASALPVDQRDSGLCGAQVSPEPPFKGGCFNKDSHGAEVGWLFTVNGQVFPRITIKASTTEIWRIANTSADMTYDLALVELGTGRPLRLQILARDGVAATVEGGAPLMTERILLMPGSRIEVGVDRRTAEGTFDETTALKARLRSYGFFTGGSAAFGDHWPAVDLAEVNFESAPEIASKSASSVALKKEKTQFVAGSSPSPSTYAPLLVTPWTAKPEGETAAGLALEPAQDDGTANTNPPPDIAGLTKHTPLHSNSSTNDCHPLAPDEERVIALAIDKSGGEEKFEIGAARGKHSDSAAWNAAIDQALAGAHAFENGSIMLCGHAGHSEIWTIVNRPKTLANGSFDQNGNNETHNFHIHQMKFEVLDVVDPLGRITAPLGGVKAHRKVDSFPVPIGGFLQIRVTFTKRQVGRFVFHCHILEHEDKGMMAEIEVRPN